MKTPWSWAAKQWRYRQNLRELDRRREEQREHVDEAHAVFKREISEIALMDAQIGKGPGAFRDMLPKPKFMLTPYVPPFKGIVCGEEHVIAMDDVLAPFGMATRAGGTGLLMSGGFPGFPYLTELTQVTEFRDISEGTAKEMTRKWIRWHSDGKHTRDAQIAVLESEFRRLHVKEWFKWAATIDGEMGRAQLFMDFDDDDEELAYPLLVQKEKIKRNSLVRLKGIEPITTYPAAYNADNPLDPTYYVPEQWYVYSKKVHASRMLTFNSHPVPDLLKPVFNFSGISLSQLAQPYVEYFLQSRDSVSKLMKNFSTNVFKTDMNGVLAGQNYELFKRRVAYFTAVQNNQGVFMIDKDTEDMMKENTPIGGLKELLAQAQEHMATVAKTPLSVMFGLSPSGLTTTAESDITIYNNHVNNEQEGSFREPIETLKKIVMLSKFGRIYDDINFDFVDLISMTEKERSQIRTATGTSDQLYVQMGAVSNVEVRQKLASDPDSGYNNIDADKTVKAPAVPGAGAKGGEQQSNSPTNPGEEKEGAEQVSEKEADSGAGNGTGGEETGGGTGGDSVLRTAVDLMLGDAKAVAMDAGMFNGNQHVGPVGGKGVTPSAKAMQHSTVAQRATNVANRVGYPSSHKRAAEAHQRAFSAHQEAFNDVKTNTERHVHQTYMDAHEAAIAMHNMESAPQPEEAEV